MKGGEHRKHIPAIGRPVVRRMMIGFLEHAGSFTLLVSWFPIPSFHV